MKNERYELNKNLAQMLKGGVGENCRTGRCCSRYGIGTHSR